MMARRAVLTGLGGLALMAGAWGTGAFRATMAAAEARIARRSSVIQTRVGALEYAIAGRGEPLMMIHGTGGGFDQGLLSRVSSDERLRADLIREGLMPISRKTDGLRNDAYWAGAPTQVTYEDITQPTLILSCEDDLFGTADTARLLADRIPAARLVLYPDGGHIWLGHDADLTREVQEFITGTPHQRAQEE